jgi:hypothetical protein
MGPIRIVGYLERDHDIKTSDATVYRVCRRVESDIVLRLRGEAPQSSEV